MIVNTKITKPRVTQKRIARAQNRPGTINITPERVRGYIELLNTIANEEGWKDNDILTDEQIDDYGSMFDGFFHLYFLLYPSNTRQQAKDCALELTKVMKDMAKDHKEFTFALFANYWYSRKEV